MMQAHSGVTESRLVEKLDYPNPDLVSGGGARVVLGWSFGGVRVEIQWSRSVLFWACQRGKSLKNGHSSAVYVYYSNFYLYLCFY